MPSGKSTAWHYVETHRGGDNPMGARPQACGQLSFQRTLPHHDSFCKQSQYHLSPAPDSSGTGPAATL